jgi:circadian clock protein KaiB
VSTPSQPQARERAPTSERLDLTLFVSGAAPASARAARRLRELCERHCPSGYDLRVVDIYEEPDAVIAQGVLAVPTLIKELPLPRRVLIGDFTDEPRVLTALGLPAAKKSEPSEP